MKEKSTWRGGCDKGSKNSQGAGAIGEGWLIWWLAANKSSFFLLTPPAAKLKNITPELLGGRVQKHLSKEVEYYDAMCFEWTLGGHKKLLSTDLTYLTAGKQRFFRWQTPLFTLFTIVSLCLSKFTLTLNQKMHVYHLGLFHCSECSSLFSTVGIP